MVIYITVIIYYNYYEHSLVILTLYNLLDYNVSLSCMNFTQQMIKGNYCIHDIIVIKLLLYYIDCVQIVVLPSVHVTSITVSNCACAHML